MTKKGNINNQVRRRLIQPYEKVISEERKKLLKDSSDDLVSFMIKLLKPEILKSDSQRILSEIELLPGRMLIDNVILKNGSLMIYELNQFDQYQHLPFYLKRKEASKFYRISVQLDTSIENRIVQNDIDQMLLSKISEDKGFAMHFINIVSLTKEVLDQKISFIATINKYKMEAILKTPQTRRLPKGFDETLFLDYLKVIPSPSDTYNSEVLKVVAYLSSKTGKAKYINFLDRASRILFSVNQGQYEKTKIGRITRNHFLYESYLSYSGEKFPMKKSITDLDDLCQKNSHIKIIEYSTAKDIIGLYKKFHKLFDDIYYFGDTGFIDFLAWTRNQISKDTGLNLTI